MATKRLLFTQVFTNQGGTAQPATGKTWDTSYTYDDEGYETGVTYFTGTSYQTGRDFLKRPYSYFQQSNPLIQSVGYNAADQATYMRFQDGSGRVQTETWVYNAFNQVTQIQTQTALLQNPTGVTPIVDLNYQYPAGQNNGQIAGLASGTTPGVNATYTYDALSRLTGVTGAAGANRTQSFSCDGWGNLYLKTGGGLNFTSGVDAATNRLTVACHDANGNLLGVGGCATYSYDVLNRLSRVAVSSSGATDGSGHTDLSAEYYSYTADNKRVTTWRPNGNSQQVFYIYGAKGEMAGLCTVQVLGQSLVCEGPRELRFAGRVFQRNNQFVVSDRLGSVVANAFVSVAGSLPAYPPYGESGGLATGVYPGNVGFATYFEDQTTGLDYADQRFYTSTYGRFMTADPYQRSANTTNSGSWNKYAYVMGDPVNFRDKRGLFASSADSYCPGEYESCDDDDSGFAPSSPGPSRGTSKSEPPPRCWEDLGAVNRTLNDLGTNVALITRDSLSSDNLGREITQLNALISSTVSQELGMTSAAVANGNPGPDYNGGHFNLFLPTNALQNIFLTDFAQFNNTFGGTGDGTRQDAVFGDPASSGYTLHSKNKGDSFDFHFDIYNPLDGPISLFKHFFVEVVGGHATSPCLDPAFTP